MKLINLNSDIMQFSDSSCGNQIHMSLNQECVVKWQKITVLIRFQKIFDSILLS